VLQAVEIIDRSGQWEEVERRFSRSVVQPPPSFGVVFTKLYATSPHSPTTLDTGSPRILSLALAEPPLNENPTQFSLKMVYVHPDHQHQSQGEQRPQHDGKEADGNYPLTGTLVIHCPYWVTIEGKGLKAFKDILELIGLLAQEEEEEEGGDGGGSMCLAWVYPEKLDGQGDLTDPVLEHLFQQMAMGGCFLLLDRGCTVIKAMVSCKFQRGGTSRPLTPQEHDDLWSRGRWTKLHPGVGEGLSHVAWVAPGEMGKDAAFGLILSDGSSILISL
jgi:hypothetical protein